MDLRFGSPFIIPETREEGADSSRAFRPKGGSRQEGKDRECGMYDAGRESERREAGVDERNESATVGMAGREEERWSRALEETKGVFSCRRRIQMESGGLFSSRSPANLPLCPRSPRINVARHAAKNRMADPREYIRCRSTLKRRSRENVQLASRACMRGP